MNKEQIVDIFCENGFYLGRMISGSKRAPEGQVCVWNANVITKSLGKVWFGDLNLTKDGEKLNCIAKKIGEPLFVLRESDCRFKTENDSVEVLISRAVWATNQ